MPVSASEHATLVPGPGLAPLVRRCIGYRHTGLAPNSHLGLPTADLTVVLSLGPPTRLAALPDPTQPPTALTALVGGLHTRPAVIAYDGELHGIQLDLTPHGARSLLGVPAGELSQAVVDLETLLGRGAAELVERLHDLPDWPARFALLERALTRRAGALAPAPPPLEHAWRLILASGGALRIGAVAAAVGWSRRQLDTRFAREYGLTPKQLSRVRRFERSHRLLRDAPERPLAEVAAACGFYDQAHMAREWNALAGRPPSRWLAAEELPFVQDGAGASPASCGP